MHKDIDLIIYYKDMQIEGLNKLINKLREDLKAQYPDLFPNKNECKK
jgi:hypothetical protein